MLEKIKEFFTQMDKHKVKQSMFPDKDDTLFSSEGEWWANVSLTYFHDGWMTYADGYKNAADTIVASINESKRVYDPLVFPVVFLYRHYLELILKGLIIKACKLFGEKIDFKENHRIDDLWDSCCALIKRVSPGDSEEELRNIGNLINEFVKVDPFATAFRYPTDKKGNLSLPDMTHINILNISNVVNRIASLLDAAWTMIEEYQSLIPHECEYY